MNKRSTSRAPAHYLRLEHFSKERHVSERERLIEKGIIVPLYSKPTLLLTSEERTLFESQAKNGYVFYSLTKGI